MVEIITIGDEILIGQIVDTNSAWMATELNNAGFQIVQITSVHDDAAHIKKALDEALGRAQVVLITGGLGPTKDDITKQTLCDYFNTRLVFDEKVLQNIRFPKTALSFRTWPVQLRLHGSKKKVESLFRCPEYLTR
ncbi:MAG: competence/damage-inducible protein cinA [Bacteroidetes bacterium]|nr:competence/damage-inducible protein cinA [Bacteroidota bacterium]